MNYTVENFKKDEFTVLVTSEKDREKFNEWAVGMCWSNGEPINDMSIPANQQIYLLTCCENNFVYFGSWGLNRAVTVDKLEKTYYTGRVVCTDTRSPDYIEGKIYKIENGKFINPPHESRLCLYESFEEFCRLRDRGKWLEIVEEE